MKYIICLMLILFSSNTFSEAKHVSKNWVVNCEEDVFNEKKPYKCSLISIDTKSGLSLLIEKKDDQLTLMFVIENSDHISEKVKSLEIETLLKVDKKETKKTISYIKRRNTTYVAVVSTLDDKEVLEMMELMKKGKKFNAKIDLLGSPILGKYTLSGFTKAYKNYIKYDSANAP